MAYEVGTGQGLCGNSKFWKFQVYLSLSAEAHILLGLHPAEFFLRPGRRFDHLRFGSGYCHLPHDSVHDELEALYDIEVAGGIDFHVGQGPVLGEESSGLWCHRPGRGGAVGSHQDSAARGRRAERVKVGQPGGSG